MKVSMFGHHRAKWQQRHLKIAKQCLPPKSAVFIMDFSQNYACHMQDEYQSYYLPRIGNHSSSYVLHNFLRKQSGCSVQNRGNKRLRDISMIPSVDNLAAQHHFFDSKSWIIIS